METARKRLVREMADMKNNPPPLCEARPLNDNIYHWEARIKGPEGSPYEGGTFLLSMKFPRNYPFQPPEVKFKTRVFHCNVNSSGELCLNILGKEWAPVITIPVLLISIMALLTDPNPASPLVQYYGRLYEKNPEEYYRRAVECTKRYALAESE